MPCFGGWVSPFKNRGQIGKRGFPHLIAGKELEYVPNRSNVKAESLDFSQKVGRNPKKKTVFIYGSFSHNHGCFLVGEMAVYLKGNFLLEIPIFYWTMIMGVLFFQLYSCSLYGALNQIEVYWLQVSQGHILFLLFSLPYHPIVYWWIDFDSCYSIHFVPPRRFLHVLICSSFYSYNKILHKPWGNMWNSIFQPCQDRKNKKNTIWFGSSLETKSDMRKKDNFENVKKKTPPPKKTETFRFPDLANG